MITRMTAEGVITIEPQSNTEIHALKHWREKNRFTLPDTTEDNPTGTAWRGGAIEILVKED